MVQIKRFSHKLSIAVCLALLIFACTNVPMYASASAEHNEITFFEFIRQNPVNIIYFSLILIAILAIVVFIFLRMKENNMKLLNKELTEASNKAKEALILRTAELQEKNRTLEKTNSEVVELLGQVVDLRDHESGSHIMRVKAYTKIIAAQMMIDFPEYKLTEYDVDVITSTSALHDVGKILIPDSTLLKSGKLTDEEYEEMKTHTYKGCELLKKAPPSWNSKYLNTALDICRYHHEKYDGSGYPEGLKGDAIPISAQIVALADCFDALTTKRVYKEAFDIEEAFEMIKSGQCGVFSPQLLICLNRCHDKLREAFEKPEKTLEQATGFFNSTNRLHGLSILLVDDNDLSLELNKDILESEGATITTATGGAKAIEILETNDEFDALLLDLIMPNMSGVDTIKVIRASANKKLQQMPAIALTADLPDFVNTDLKSAGFDTALEKPLVVSEISRELIRIMKERSYTAEEKYETALHSANTDSLTGVNNVTAYTSAVTELSEEITQTSHTNFAVIMCDINNLKAANDTHGHNVGDIYIKNSSKVICDVFKHSPVYRIGGDEFVVIVRGGEFLKLDERMRELEQAVKTAEAINTIESGKASFSYGSAVYDPLLDTSVSDVVKRADIAMYKYKKKHHASTRG